MPPSGYNQSSPLHRAWGQEKTWLELEIGCWSPGAKQTSATTSLWHPGTFWLLSATSSDEISKWLENYGRRWYIANTVLPICVKLIRPYLDQARIPPGMPHHTQTIPAFPHCFILQSVLISHSSPVAGNPGRRTDGNKFANLEKRLSKIGWSRNRTWYLFLLAAKLGMMILQTESKLN